MSREPSSYYFSSTSSGSGLDVDSGSGRLPSDLVGLGSTGVGLTLLLYL